MTVGRTATPHQTDRVLQTSVWHPCLSRRDSALAAASIRAPLIHLYLVYIAIDTKEERNNEKKKKDIVCTYKRSTRTRTSKISRRIQWSIYEPHTIVSQLRVKIVNNAWEQERAREHSRKRYVCVWRTDVSIYTFLKFSIPFIYKKKKTSSIKKSSRIRHLPHGYTIQIASYVSSISRYEAGRNRMKIYFSIIFTSNNRKYFISIFKF